MKDWDDMSFGEKAMTLPDRHPVPIRMLIALFMLKDEYEWKYLKMIASAMGWIEVTDTSEGELDIGEDKPPLRLTVRKQSWINTFNTEGPKDE